MVGYYALLSDKGTIGGRDHRKNCPCVPYWLNSSQPLNKALLAFGAAPRPFYTKNSIDAFTSMEININFSVPASASASDICTILSRVMTDIAVNDSEGNFGPGEIYTVNHDGECIATYDVLAEPDAESYGEESCFPYNCYDMSDDADALASAGYGTDEDYGYYGED